MKEIIVNNEKELRFAFNKFNLNRAEVNDRILITRNIKLTSDLIIDVPVKICFLNDKLMINNAGFSIRFKSKQKYGDGDFVVFETCHMQKWIN